ncbi:membrane protein insertase YidC [Rickettsiales endosymbiont of Stachyamoeba lipophora]|uniref:membrane protein insertase YidC n=1 Tax=Rickettsiales endosymbiont of Stachyamoeba lipophora TaxID=2486578 RepID=UPI000F64DDC7|nr:membrane protein insertase YidC [Rickettsiales endosymbiont of Stachyamoeba lipophora]AZL15730.1 membrane protein insertase YidC [Rickettsiales endosymbiont of Stachyamoeba lipophora]
MDEIRKIIMTFVICAIAIVGWQYFFKPKPQNINQTVLQQEVEILPREQAIAATNSDRLKVHTSKLYGSINLKGLRFDDLKLLEFNESQDSQKKVELLNPSNTSYGEVVTIGWLSPDKSLKLPNVDSLWHSNYSHLISGTPTELSWDNGEGLIFKIVLELDEEYMLKIKQYVKNNSTKDVVISPYGLIAQYKPEGEKPEKFAILHQGLTGMFNGVLQEVSYDKIQDDKKLDQKLNENGWLAITDKYWLTSITPDTRYKFDSSFTFKRLGRVDKYQVDYVSEQILIKSGQTLNYTNFIYAGAKKLDLLDKYEQQYNISNFDHAIDFGWLYFITKPMIKVLQFFYKHVNNFGIAILMLTVVIKLIMLPLANKSYISMTKMKSLQPVVARLQKKYKEDKMRFNYELMQLYKREKINPLSGCLPLLLQIPVFFALYKVLFVSVEMRHAPFFGWIHDLSAPDPTSLLNFFGLAPWAAPDFLSIGVLPVLMGITMYMQQRLNPKATDPVQEQVMKFMPLVFIFMFHNFPSGLVLYWVWNNILSIGQQWLIQRSTLKKIGKID